MPDTHGKTFFSKPLSFSNKFFFAVGSNLRTTYQEADETIFGKQISSEKFENVWDIITTKQRVRFWNKIFTTRQILDWKEIQSVTF